MAQQSKSSGDGSLKRSRLNAIMSPSAESGQAQGEILNYLFFNKISRRYALRNDILTYFSLRHQLGSSEL